MTQSSSTEVELKPCPFCGGEAAGAIVDGVEFVECTSCQASITSDSGTTWNTRASLTPSPVAPVEDVERVTQADRDAAADLIESYWGGADAGMMKLAKSYRSGHCGGVFARAFARHRLAALATPTDTARLNLTPAERTRIISEAVAKSSGYQGIGGSGRDSAARYAINLTLAALRVDTARIRNEAFEEAAKVAEDRKRKALDQINAGKLPYLYGIERDTAHDIAAEIRALSTLQTGEG